MKRGKIVFVIGGFLAYLQKYLLIQKENLSAYYAILYLLYVGEIERLGNFFHRLPVVGSLKQRDVLALYSIRICTYVCTVCNFHGSRKV